MLPLTLFSDWRGIPEVSARGQDKTAREARARELSDLPYFRLGLPRVRAAAGRARQIREASNLHQPNESRATLGSPLYSPRVICTRPDV